jgi:CPA2 family monovalent cation:H+ antiporter-2
MPHNISLITTIAAALGAGLLFGYLATRLKLPALVGYLAAGIIIGPATPGFVADTALAGQLAEIGVMLMMFGVGLHFSLDDLWAVRKVALPGAVLQIAVATALGMGLALLGLEHRRRPGVRPGAVGGQHGGAAARAGGARHSR